MPAGSSLQGGTVTANLAIDGPLDHLVVTGPLNVANTRLAGFSFASKMAAFAALSTNCVSAQTLQLQPAPAFGIYIAANLKLIFN